MPGPNRYYPPQILKVLFGSSGNQCAFPGCPNPLIAPATEMSDALVIAQICHIYAASENGPRGKHGLTEKEKNSADNLILLCPTHHRIVDGQHETYPAQTLKAWKIENEERVNRRRAAELQERQPQSVSHLVYAQKLVDQEIERRLLALRQGRFFFDSHSAEPALQLGRAVGNGGELSNGSDEVRSRALAWCARIRARIAQPNEADQFLSASKRLSSNIEQGVAEAFIASAKGNQKDALKILADIASPLARTAALQIVTYHESNKSASHWLTKSELTFEDLDGDGKFIFLMQKLELGEWQEGIEALREIRDEDFRATPVLLHASALTHLVQAIPVEFRSFATGQVPFDAANFPLASDIASQESLSSASRLFAECATAARALGCQRAANIAEDYALWLELRDPTSGTSGRKKLEESMRDAEHALRRLHLALQFGIKLDLDAVEREIERRVSVAGSLSAEEANARFALAFVQKTPKAVADYIGRWRSELYEHLDKTSIQAIEIEMLARAALPDQAKQRLNELVAQGLAERDKQHLERIIAEATGTNPIEARRQDFERSGDLRDLANLVEALEASQDWSSISHFGKLLFQRTNALVDAERLAFAFNITGQFSELSSFLRARPDFRELSVNLKLFWCWSLYREGDLEAASTELQNLKTRRDDFHVRSLTTNIAIASGDWSSLAEFVSQEWENREARSGDELVSAADLAHLIGSPRAKDLLFAATSKAPDDANILATAYFLATRAGWEDELQVNHWLKRAADLSGEAGPVRSMSLKEMLERKPDWDRRESQTWSQLNKGEIPLFAAALLLNRSVIDLVVLPALANRIEQDTRRRGIVFAYSGARPRQVTAALKTIAVDASGLITLSLLGLLEKTFQAHAKVLVPHTTLAWLFEEKRRALFHQPSRLRDAHDLLRLVSENAIQAVSPAGRLDPDLVQSVGEKLASLFSEARRETAAGCQAVVVRSAPVHRIGSLMEEEADLSAERDYLCSCTLILDKLKEKGQVTVHEEQRARAYLSLHERIWTHPLTLSDNAVLYLDDLSVTYLQHAKLLEKLKPAGLQVRVLEREANEAREIVRYGHLSLQVSDFVEQTRAALQAAIKTNKVKLGQMPASGDDDLDQNIRQHPTFNALDLARHADALVVDDRSINQHNNIQVDGRNVPILSTVEIIDLLRTTNEITLERWLQARDDLRRFGYALTPITTEELQYLMQAAPIVEGVVIETAELKTFRESLLRLRMSSIVQLPKEAFWLDGIMKVLSQTVRSVWVNAADAASARARSNWLVKQFDPRGWAHCMSDRGAKGMISIGYPAQLLLLATPPAGINPKLKDNYFEWFEETLMAPLKDTEPEAFEWIISRTEKLVTEAVDQFAETTSR